MMKSDQLYQIHERLCEIKQNNLPFGGVSIVLFGDLMQLRPIQGSPTFEPPKNPKYKAVSEVMNLWDMFKCVELEHNHRQGPDREYAELLNRLRFKSKADELSDEDAQLLNDRVRDPPKGINVTKIFGKNVNVNEENIKRLNKLEGKKYTMKAVHSPKDRNVKINADGSIEKTLFLDVLELKVGARVMLINNVNTIDGLVNGAQGYVQEILTSGSDKKVKYVLVKFDDPKIGDEQKRKFKFLQNITKNMGIVSPGISRGFTALAQT